MKKILNLLLIIFISLCLCVVLTGCGKTNEEKTDMKVETKTEDLVDTNEEVQEEVDDDIDNTSDVSNTTNTTKKTNTAKDNEPVIDMPENVRIYAFQDYGPNNNNMGVYFDVIKIGNNALRTQVNTTGKNRVVQNNKGYHYFKYKGDNKWDLYYRTDSKDWYLYTPDVTVEQFNTFMNINHATREESELEGNEHETIHVDGIGDVDTVHLVLPDPTPDRLVETWYSPELKRNIKMYTQYTQTGAEILTYDTSVTSFGIAVP